jgi:hypothetical protein
MGMINTMGETCNACNKKFNREISKIRRKNFSAFVSILCLSVADLIMPITVSIVEDNDKLRGTLARAQPRGRLPLREPLRQRRGRAEGFARRPSPTWC